MMQRWVYWIWIFLICTCQWARAAVDADPWVRTQWLDAKGYAVSEDWQPYAGEPVVLAVDVLTPTWFSRAPRFPGLQLRDVISLQGSSFATNFSERINGVMHAVQRREYRLYPQRSGQFVVPGLELHVWVAGEGGPSEHKLRSLPLLLQVLPLPLPDIPSQGLPLVADEVSVSQQLASAQSGVWQVGDLVERRVVIAAEGTPGILIPSLALPQVDGLQSASAEVRIDDQDDRGRLTGKRTEIYQYRLLREGILRLPEFTLTWWNSQQQVWETTSVPSLQLQVQPAVLAESDSTDNSIAFERLRSVSPVAALMLGVLSVALWLVWQSARAGQRLWLKLKTSEAYLYRRLRAALRRRHPRAITISYYAWVRCCGSKETQSEQWLQDWAEVCMAVDNGHLLQRDTLARLAIELDIRRAGATGNRDQTESKKRLDSLKPLNPA